MIVKLAPYAMSTVEILKMVLSIPDEDDSYDTYLILLINYASAWVERMTGRSFGLKRREEDIAGSGLQGLVLEHYPIRIIHEIREQGGEALSPKSYSFRNRGHIGVVYKDDGWLRKAYPTGLVPDYVLTKQYLRADYTAGYILPKDETDESPEDWLLPADLQGLIWQIAGQELILSDNDASGLAAFSIADVSWTFDKNPRQSWLELIDAYKRVV